MDCTCAELTGSGSDATAASKAFFMMPIVSGGKDAFEKSFIASNAAFRDSPCRLRHRVRGRFEHRWYLGWSSQGPFAAIQLDCQTKSRERNWFNQDGRKPEQLAALLDHFVCADVETGAATRLFADSREPNLG
jgi:hypothetical protein